MNSTRAGVSFVHVELRWVAHCLSALALVFACVIATPARAQPQTESKPDATSVWGGSTLGAGNAVWFRPSAGYDFNPALIAAELGYGRAILPDLDASLAASFNTGFTNALSGTLRGRWGALRAGRFRLAADVPVSYTSFISGDAPHLVMWGTEPGVMMSTALGNRFGLFYGAALRFYHADLTYFIGPQTRLGCGWVLGNFRAGFGASISHVFVTATPAMTLFSAEASLTYLFGDP